MVDLKLLGVCGLYCGACYHYRAPFPESSHLLEDAIAQGRDPEGFTCRGCRSDKRYIHPGCAQCELRACAEARGILHCGLCPEFPCDALRAFRDDGRTHHLDVCNALTALKSTSPDAWLEEQARRWTCVCGAPYSWYEVTCRRCGASLESYGNDPRAKAR